MGDPGSPRPSKKHQVFMGDKHRSPTGGTSLPDQDTEEKMEPELELGGAGAWVVLAAPAGKGVFPRSLCPTCRPHFTKPQSPARRSPAKADRNPPRYQRCHLYGDTESGPCIHGASSHPAFSQSRAAWPSGGQRCQPASPFTSYPPSPSAAPLTPTQTFHPLSPLSFTAGK